MPYPHSELCFCRVCRNARIKADFESTRAGPMTLQRLLKHILHGPDCWCPTCGATKVAETKRADMTARAEIVQEAIDAGHERTLREIAKMCMDTGRPIKVETVDTGNGYALKYSYQPLIQIGPLDV